MRATPILLVLAALAGAACSGGTGRPSAEGPPAGRPASEPPPSTAFRFVDATASSGLGAFRQVNGTLEKRFIPEQMGAGVAWIDHDGDGDLDAYLSNGARLDPVPGAEPPRDALYCNEGGGRFVDCSEAAGIGDAGWTNGVAVADVDGDSFPDLYLTNYGPNVLLRNRGDGSFEDVTERAGVGDPSWSTGSAFFDADGDGDLDLYVVNYVEFDRDFVPADTSHCIYKGIMVAYGPRGLAGASDRLYRNDGDLRFTDVSAEAGIDGPELYGFQVLPLDHDEDGDLDLFVANDSVENLLWRNEGGWRFTDEALAAGLAFGGDGATQACMGAALGDANGNGRLDLFVTNFENDHYTLYRNEGRGLFSDVSHHAGLAQATIPKLGWGAAFADFDADGESDLFVANGHVYPQVEEHGLGSRYAQLNQLFAGVGGGRFADRSEEAGPGLQVAAVSRGAALGDVDGDGDVDVLVGNLDGPPTLILNETPARGAWVEVLLRGAAPNPDAIGAVVVTESGGRRRAAGRVASASFLSAHSPWLHFGLGPARSLEALEVRWPDGTVSVHRDLPVNRRLVVDRVAGTVTPVD